VSDYNSATKTSMKIAVALQCGVDPQTVSCAVTAASVRIVFTVRTSDSAQAATVQSAMDRVFATAASANSFFAAASINVTVSSTTPVSIIVPAPIAQSVQAQGTSSDSSSSSSGAMAAIIVLSVAVFLLLGCGLFALMRLLRPGWKLPGKHVDSGDSNMDESGAVTGRVTIRNSTRRSSNK